MKDLILKVLQKYRGRPNSNEYIAEQIENEIRLNQNECRFKWIQEQNSITLAIKAAKQDETIPKSNVGER
jgi:hypothetical protein